MPEDGTKLEILRSSDIGSLNSIRYQYFIGLGVLIMIIAGINVLHKLLHHTPGVASTTRTFVPVAG